MITEITRNKEICGGKACIKGTRIRVIDIVERYKILNEKPEEIANNFGISISAVFAALWYYYEHPQEMQEEIEKNKESIRKLRQELATA